MKIWTIGFVAVAVPALVLLASGPAGAGDELQLPQAMAEDDLSTSTAQGAGADASVDEQGGNVSSEASAEASIDDVTIVGPISTGSVSGFGELPGGDLPEMQISTGVGNIQQDVSATAFVSY